MTKPVLMTGGYTYLDLARRIGWVKEQLKMTTEVNSFG